MHQHINSKSSVNMKIQAALFVALIIFVTFFMPSRAAAACTVPATSYGTVTSTVNVSTAGTYRLWSRVKPADTTNNSYMLEIDGGTCYTVGGGTGLPANAWTWTSSLTSGAKLDVALSAGTHTIKMIGIKPNLSIDRLVLTTDTACTPTTLGDNCANPADTTPPSASVSQPLSGTTVKGVVNVTATANDDTGGSGVAKVEFFVDGVLRGTDTTGPNPYTLALDTSSLTNANHTITVKSYDNAGNVSVVNPAVTVTVANGDTVDPKVSLTGVANGQVVTNGSIALEAVATDDVAVAKVEFYVDGTFNKAEVNAPYCMVEANGSCAPWSTTALTNGTHSIMAVAYDTTGNTSSAIVNFTVQNADTNAPTTPGSVSASALSATQAKVTWTASTDDVGVTSYCISRNDGKTVCPVTTALSYTDTTVLPSTTYSYTVTARDAAGNNSIASAPASVTTPAAPDTAAPSVPTNVTATAVSSSQINVSWAASTDNVGVAAYDVYRNGAKIGSTTSTSYGNTGLLASNAYSYTVVARDSAGNASAQSSPATATTEAVAVTAGTLEGAISVTSGKLQGASVVMNVNNKTLVYSVSSTGKYSIPNLPAGTYIAQYTAKNMATQTRTVTIGAGSTTTINVTLSRR